MQDLISYIYGENPDNKIYYPPEKSLELIKYIKRQPYLLNKDVSIDDKMKFLFGDDWRDNAGTHLSMVNEDKVLEPNSDYERLYHNTSVTLEQIFLKKNRDYGSSVQKSYDKYEKYGHNKGLQYLVGRLGDKMSRIENLAFNDNISNVDESISDTLLDLANYAILAYMSYKEHN